MEIKTKSNRKTPKIGNRLIVLLKKECNSTLLHHSVNLSRTVPWMLRKRQLLSPWRSNLFPCECTETLLPIRTMVALLLSLPMDFTSLPTKFSLPYKNTFGHRAGDDPLRKSGAVKVIKDENDGKRGHRALIHRNWCHSWPMWRICITCSSAENDHATSKCSISMTWKLNGVLLVIASK